MTHKWVYFFTEGNKEMKALLGGKGANLAEMSNLRVPVPPGFTITTEACDAFYQQGKELPDGCMDQINQNLAKLESQMGKSFGDEHDPLLVSVRSGAAQSMPGMMDTVLNLGLTLQSVEGLAAKTNNPRFAYDSYRRFIQMFSNVVMGLESHEFEAILDTHKRSKGIECDVDLSAGDMKQLVEKFLNHYQQHTNEAFPQDPMDQLLRAIDAVFNSWNNERALIYRELNNITGLGTAVNVQAMVYGNMGNTSGTGVAFSRNPSTGANELYGEYLINAQGEDVVSGVRTPLPIASLKNNVPDTFTQFTDIVTKLELHYGDMQDIEFTIQEGTLFLLQTRIAKRTAQASLKIAVDMVNEGLISKEEALLRVCPHKLKTLLHKQLDPSALDKHTAVAKGLPASPGAAVGKVVFSAQDAQVCSEEGHKVILVRRETSPEDIKGMVVAQGILTALGGMTSHAAVVARGMGKCCVAGCSAMTLDKEHNSCTIAGVTINKGDVITLDGSTGEVYVGALDVVDPTPTEDFTTIMQWADGARRLGVRTNAETPRDAQIARDFGAQGIGLCRTEHMFFEDDRIMAMREMIFAQNKDERVTALNKLLPMQRSDFEGILHAMEGYPVTIRLLDPPLHEFLPHTPHEINDLAQQMGLTVEALAHKVENLRELNPMLGHRGVRLAVTYEEIAEMQVRAIMEAACNLKVKDIDVQPEIMIPLVGNAQELKLLESLTRRMCEKVMKEKNTRVDYLVGTMIEVPRAALTADEIAHHAEFFSFGTNDLTQMTLGFSRDDAGKFLHEYLEKGLLEHDPFAVLDTTGVGQLVEIAAQKGRKTRKDIHLGICGEHGGEPKSVAFCHDIGLDYVSCSPFRVPVARLSAAHAAIKEARKK